MGLNKPFAIALVLALTGSAIAAERLYMNEGTEVSDVQTVQQHAVFLEIIVQSAREDEELVPRGAVVGLVQKCKEERTKFDNAVLWFNDQFLFGQKQNEATNKTPSSALGETPFNSEIYKSDCFIPSGFAHLVEDGKAEKAERAMALQEDLEDVPRRDTQSSVRLVNWEYEESFYVTDPNGAQWIVDRMRWESTDETDGVVAEIGDGIMYTVHLQVDRTNGLGFSDDADWAYRDGTIRQGMPLNESAEDERIDQPSVDYNFLLAFEFESYGEDRRVEHGEGGADNNHSAREGNAHPYRAQDNETRTDGGDCVEGGDGVSDVSQGCDANPRHDHLAVDLEVFYNATAPNFVEDNRYWDEYGSPPSVNEDCTDATSGSDEQKQAVRVRTFDLCDRVAETPYHAHDGSETIRGP